jgi:hypothetical protein
MLRRLYLVSPCMILNIGKVTLGAFIKMSIPCQLQRLGQENDSCITLTPTPCLNRSILSRALEMVAVEDGCKNFCKFRSGLKLTNDTVLEHDGYVFNRSECLWQVINCIMHFCNI